MDDMDDNTKKLVDQAVKAQDEMENVRRVWEDVWDEVIDNLAFSRTNVKQNARSTTKKRGQYVYDGSPGSALNVWRSGMQGYLVSPSIQWFKLRAASPQLDRDDTVRAWLQDCEEHMYGVFNRSNFYDQISEFFHDAGSLCTAHMDVIEDVSDSAVLFNTVHTRNVWIEEDPFKRVRRWHRKRKFRAEEAVSIFGEKNVREQIAEDAKGNKKTEFEFLHVILRNDKPQPDKLNWQGRPFISLWIDLGARKDDEKRLVKIDGYWQTRRVTWRTRKNPDEIYGRGPGIDALVDIQVLNQMGKSMLKAGHMAIDPPMNVPAEMRGRTRLVPAGLNYYTDANKVIRPVNTGVNYPIAADREDRRREIIKDHFSVDLFMMLANSERQMTAYEVMKRESEKAVVIGPQVGRLTHEALDPLIDAVFDIEFTAARLPQPPDILLETGDGRISVDYTGPLAQNQKKLFRTQGIIQSLEAVRPIVEMSPETLDAIDFDAAVEEIFEANGMPERVLRDPEQVAAIRQQRAEQMAAQQAAEMAEKVGKTLPAMGKKTEAGSPLAAMTG